MYRDSKINLIAEQFKNKLFFKDNGVKYFRRKVSGEYISDEFIDTVFVEAYNKLVQFEMPIVMCDILGFTNKMLYKNELNLYHKIIFPSSATLHQFNQ